MGKKSGLLPLSLLAISGVISCLRIAFLFVTYYIEFLKLDTSLRLSIGLLGFGVPILLTSLSSLALSVAWLAKREFESLGIGFVLAILATASCVESGMLINIGIGAIKNLG